MALESMAGKTFKAEGAVASGAKGDRIQVAVRKPISEHRGRVTGDQNIDAADTDSIATHGKTVPEAAGTGDRSAPERHRSRRYVPDAGFVQAMADIFFFGAGLALVLPAALPKFGVTSPEHALYISGIALFTNITLLFASGCYRRDALLNSAVARARLPVTLGLGALVIYGAFRYGLAAVFPTTALFASSTSTAMLALIVTGIVLGTTTASRYAFYALARARFFHRRVIVIGTGERALHLHRHLGQGADGMVNNLQYVPVSIIGGLPADVAPALSALLIDSDSRPINTLALDLKADEIVVAADDRRGLSIEKLLGCKALGLPITDFNTFFEREAKRIDLHWLDQSWLVYSNGFQMREIDVFLKRVMDIAGSLVLLLLSAPVLLCAAIAVALESRDNIFYKQTRVTKEGRHFELYKLRTMRSDAETLGPQWAAENDPRITRVGKFLRRTRIDEIPQLLNVLRGDMSLVGPRPERPVFVEQLAKEFPLYHLRHKVKAGLTGWAQINFTYGASIADAERKLEYDLYYVKNYSLVLDISILLQTFWVLIWPKGVR
jgi:sugar transferase (PEP-CTERM system associated)